MFIKDNYKDENLYFDISTIQLISNQWLIKAIDFVGSDKILFATDTPYGVKDNIQRNIDRIKNLEISNDDKNMILGANMQKLLKLC